MTARIILTRHGETTFNAARVLQFPDTPLSERGEDQAQRLARRLTGRPIGTILASDYLRAQQTARAVSEAAGVAVITDPLLRERNFGDIRGRSYDDLEVEPYAPDYHPPNGESWPQFHARVDRAWERMARVAEGTEGETLVVTHALVCRSILDRLVARPDGDPIGPLANTAVSELERSSGWRATLVGCARHLD